MLYELLLELSMDTNMIWAGAWDFQQFDILTASVDLGKPLQPPIKLETPNGVQSVA